MSARARMMVPFVLALWPALAAACGPTGLDGDAGPDGGAATAYWPADEVIEAPGQTGSGVGDPGNAVDGVHGGGQAAGNMDDVYSLGYEDGADNYLILGWSGRRVVDGPGVDFSVFENGFLIGDGPECFMDQVVIHLSGDGTTWVPFPHDYTHEDETAYSTLPADWPGFAGVSPVLFNEETNPVDPFDHGLAGGDQFDLADLPDGDPAAAAIEAGGFLYVKLVTAPSLTNPDTGEAYPRDAISNGADIDGVIARYLEE